ncbi:MAG TPA: hypothetical protein VGA00_00020 [Acidiferrobacterales bacterium]
MFLAHFAVGFGAKALAPRVSLGTLFLAAQFLDLLWPTLLLGVERVEIRPGVTAFTPLDFVHYPISHSLVLVLAWGLAFGLVYGVLRRQPREALVLGVCVVSHWLLDRSRTVRTCRCCPGTGRGSGSACGIRWPARWRWRG